MGEKVSVREGDHMLEITIDRPDKRNCLDNETLSEWLEVLQSIKITDDYRAVVVRGAGGNFSAGADLSMFLDAIESGNRRTIERFIRLIHRVTDELETLRIPTVAAIEGFALAGGLEVLLACDIRVATESAVIGDQHANYGLVAGGGGTQRLFRQIDTCKANELMYTGRRLSGDEAAEWGIVNRAVPGDEFDEAVAEIVARLTEKSGEAASLTKFLMHLGRQVNKRSGLELERKSVVDYYFTEDAKEGFAAFADGRSPNF